MASQLWILLAYAADSLAVAAQGLIADRIGAGVILEARKVAMLVRCRLPHLFRRSRAFRLCLPLQHSLSHELSEAL